MEVVSQFEKIHKKLDETPEGRARKGKRYNQEALYKAGIVMIVAAWQAYNEKLLEICLDSIENTQIKDEAPPWVLQMFQVRRSQLFGEISKFNTPNCQNVQRLFTNAIGFDPLPSLNFRVRRRQWSERETSERTDVWVNIRHTIAHGYPIYSTHKFNDYWYRDRDRKDRLVLGSIQEAAKHFKRLVFCMEEAVPKFLKDKYKVELK